MRLAAVATDKYTHRLPHRYVLERHLKRDEVVHPLVELGKFRGDPVYSRSSVLQLKAAENWMRQGRKVKEGAQPMKWVKQRAMTVNKQRAIEMALSERRDRDLQVAGKSGGSAEGFASEDGVMQGLYAEHQTELYRPNPVIDVSVMMFVVSSSLTIPWRLRGEYQRMTLGILICMCQPCCLRDLCIFPVGTRFAILTFISVSSLNVKYRQRDRQDCTTARV